MKLKPLAFLVGLVLGVIAAVVLCTAAHAYTGGPHGRSGTAGGQRTGMSSTQTAASPATQRGGSAGRSVFAPQESSAFDAFQPWPQAEMRQFAKK